MNASDVIGWIVNDTYYCPTCTPTNEEGGDDAAHPIFGDSETDSFNHCAVCEELIPENLTDSGWKWILETAEMYLTRREGRAEIQRQWHAHCGDWGSDEEENTIMRLWGEALDENNVHRSAANLKGTR